MRDESVSTLTIERDDRLPREKALLIPKRWRNTTD
jgi:hypothetical protein